MINLCNVELAINWRFYLLLVVRRVPLYTLLFSVRGSQSGAKRGLTRRYPDAVSNLPALQQATGIIT